MALTHPKLSGNLRLQAAANNNPALGALDSGNPAVRLLQEALVELGFKLPQSTKPSGDLDGVYGLEMHAVVRAFQRKHGLKEDGAAGHDTLHKIDTLLPRGGGSGGGGGGSVTSPLGKVTVWFNVFIPQHIPGLTFPLSGSPGVTAVTDDSLPLGIKRTIQTNNRLFDDTLSPHLSSLLHSQVIVDFGLLSAGSPSITQTHTPGLVFDVDSATHKPLGSRRLSATASFVTVFSAPYEVRLRVQLSVSHPFGSLLSLAGNMDVTGDLIIRRGSRNIEVKGKVDDFPAYEAYATEGGSAFGKAIYTLSVPPGKKPKDLLGSPSRAASGSVVL